MAVGFGVDAGGDVGECVAHEQAGGAAGELHHFQASLYLGPGFGKRFAVLAGDQCGELLEVLSHQVMEAKQDAGALDGGGFRPGG